MRAAAVTTLFIAAIVFQAVGAAAQSHVEAVPSVTIGSIYDDNLSHRRKATRDTC